MTYTFAYGHDEKGYWVVKFPDGYGQHKNVDDCKQAAEIYFNKRGIEPKFLGMC